MESKQLKLKEPFRPDHPRFINYEDRLQTFQEWPMAMPHTKEELANAGFCYIGVGDQVFCFCCSGTIGEWREGHNPWRRHAETGNRCVFLLHHKGPAFIKHCLEAAQKSIVKVHDSSPVIQDYTENTLNCRICLAFEPSTLFQPCGHLIACLRCAIQNQKCILCKEPIRTITRISLSAPGPLISLRQRSPRENTPGCQLRNKKQ